MSNMPRYFLSSLDSYVLETTRTCDFIAHMRFQSGKECVLAEVEPPIPGQPFGLQHDISRVVLANRHAGDTLTKIAEFPCFVHVARPVVDGIETLPVVNASDLENIAWGELYRSKEDADQHIFDR
jgi:hypothetical protein